MHDARPVREALRAYYAAHGLPPDGGAGRWYFVIRVGPLVIPAPNPPMRKRALLAHDLHHLITGYDTIFSRGEMIIAGYEIGAGCGRAAFAWLVNLWLLALGLLVTPRQVFAAFVRGRRCRSLYRGIPDAPDALDAPDHPQGRPILDREQLLAMTIGELRRRTGTDQPSPEPTPADRSRFALWGAAAWLVLLASGAAAVGGVAAAVRALWILLSR